MPSFQTVTSPTRPPLIPLRDIGPFPTNVIPANPLNPIDGGEASISRARFKDPAAWMRFILLRDWCKFARLHYTLQHNFCGRWSLWSGIWYLQQPTMLSQSVWSNDAQYNSLSSLACRGELLLQCSFQTTPLCFFQKHCEFLCSYRLSAVILFFFCFFPPETNFIPLWTPIWSSMHFARVFSFVFHNNFFVPG